MLRQRLTLMLIVSLGGVIVLLMMSALMTTPITTYAQTFVTNTPAVPSQVTVPQGETVAGQIFDITGLELDATGYGLNKLTIDIANLTTSSQSAVVWYLLSSQGEGELWERALYQQPPTRIDEIAGNSTATIEFDGPPTGTLRGDLILSVWVHSFDVTANSSTHSDGFAYDVPLTFGDPFEFSVPHVEVIRATSADAPSLVFVTFEITNNTSEWAELGYAFSVAAPDDATPWATGLLTTPFQFFSVGGGETITVTSRQEVMLPAATYAVTGWLHRRANGEQTQIALALATDQILP